MGTLSTALSSTLRARPAVENGGRWEGIVVQASIHGDARGFPSAPSEFSLLHPASRERIGRQNSVRGGKVMGHPKKKKKKERGLEARYFGAIPPIPTAHPTWGHHPLDHRRAFGPLPPLLPPPMREAVGQRAFCPRLPPGTGLPSRMRKSTACTKQRMPGCRVGRCGPRPEHVKMHPAFRPFPPPGGPFLWTPWPSWSWSSFTLSCSSPPCSSSSTPVVGPRRRLGSHARRARATAALLRPADARAAD